MATIQGVYVALFGRPADPFGLAYWKGVTDDGADLSKIGDLAQTQEYQDRFVGQSNAQVVNAIYQSLFGRNADVAGLTFWVNGLSSGEFTINDVAIRILDGAQGSDKTIIDTKVAAADAFTASIDTAEEIIKYDGNAAAQIGRDFLAGVTTTAPTQAEVDAAVAAVVSGGGVVTDFTLTPGIDVIPGTAGNDTIIGGVGGAAGNTLGAADVINGGAGTDTFKFISEGAADVSVTPNLTSVEKLSLQSAVDAGKTTTLNLINATGVEEIWNERSTAALNVTNVQELATVGVKGEVAAAYNVAFKNSLASGTDDSVTIALDGATIAALGVSGGAAGYAEFETLNFVAAGKSTVTALNDANGAALNATKAVNVEGEGSLTVTNALSNTVTSIDASKNSGGVTFTVGTGSGAQNIKGGSGNDTFKLGGTLTTADVVDGGEGKNTVGVTVGSTLVTGLQVTNFQTLDIGGADANANTYDLSKLAGITTLKVGSAINSTGGSDVIINNLAKGAGIEINNYLGTALADGLVVNVKDAGAGSPNDAIDVVVKGLSAITTTGILDINDIETVTISADKSSAVGNVVHTVTDLTADEALTVKVGNGSAGLTITNLNAKSLVLFDATEATKAVSVTTNDAFTATNGVAFKLGAGADTLDLTGSTVAGGDFYITGGAGGDKITLTAAASEIEHLVYTTAADSQAGKTEAGATQYDVITNFNAAGGNPFDKIDLSAFNIAAGQQSAFVKAPGTAITDTGLVAGADQLNFFINAGTKYGVAVVSALDVDGNTGGALAGNFIYVDVNGDGNFNAADDLTIAIVGGNAADIVNNSFTFA
ncbi:MAG: DUF4214 domain-containing protein [Devosia sp.]|nr:DUF4214 domain-containing protein [Devosia sp.]